MAKQDNTKQKYEKPYPNTEGQSFEPLFITIIAFFVLWGMVSLIELFI